LRRDADLGDKSIGHGERERGRKGEGEKGRKGEGERKGERERINKIPNELNHNKSIRRIGRCGIIAIIPLFLVACNTVREISIEVLVPAEVTIPDYIQSVAFVNRSYMPWLARDPQDTLARPPEDLSILDTIINNKFFLGLFDALNSSPLFDLEDPTAFQFRRTDSSRFPEPISEENIQYFSDAIHADAMICLEGYRISDSLETWNELDNPWYNADDYYLENGVVFYVEGTIQWRIYDILNRMIIDEFIATDTLEWTAYGDFIEEAMYELPEVVDGYREYAYHRGYDFGMRISPSWSRVRRFYFIMGNRTIRKAAEFAYYENWEEAAALWKQESGSDNPKIAAKAAFNLALYSEKKDLLIPAIDWATKSYELIQEKYTKTYLGILEQRKLNKLKLQQQIPLK
jgi:hypothetical protein